jgi:deazaflavin-dependent oxidoreductase (nitroreductase family)
MADGRLSMTFEKTTRGSYGARMPGGNTPVAKWVNRMMIKRYRRSGGKRAMGMDMLVLTTVGAKSGQRRETLLGSFPDGDGVWLIVASAAGSATNPAWYHNIAAHPDQVEIEVGGKKVGVTATQLSGQERDEAWQRITQAVPRYTGYATKTDRKIPIIRLEAAR